LLIIWLIGEIDATFVCIFNHLGLYYKTSPGVFENHFMNLYIGNLSWSISEEELQQLFEAYGEVSSCKIVKDKMTNRSKGFGFVEMPNSDEANAAISQLNGKDVGGRSISVNEARPREERPAGGGGFRGGNRGGGGNYGGGGGYGGGGRGRY
jgi:cold-inducible RNA-binding protein